MSEFVAFNYSNLPLTVNRLNNRATGLRNILSNCDSKKASKIQQELDIIERVLFSISMVNPDCLK